MIKPEWDKLWTYPMDLLSYLSDLRDPILMREVREAVRYGQGPGEGTGVAPRADHK